MPEILRRTEVLREQTHCEVVYRPFQFHQRSQFFIGMRDKTVSVAVRVNNPDRFYPRASQDRARIAFECRMADDPALMSSANPARLTAVRSESIKQLSRLFRPTLQP